MKPCKRSFLHLEFWLYFIYFYFIYFFLADAFIHLCIGEKDKEIITYSDREFFPFIIGKLRNKIYLQLNFNLII